MRYSMHDGTDDDAVSNREQLAGAIASVASQILSEAVAEIGKTPTPEGRDALRLLWLQLALLEKVAERALADDARGPA